MTATPGRSRTPGPPGASGAPGTPGTPGGSGTSGTAGMPGGSGTPGSSGAPGTPGGPSTPGGSSGLDGRQSSAHAERGTRGPVRVVLVDDHRMFRTGVRAELSEAMSGTTPVCEFVGEAPDVEAAVAVIRAQR
ncbi:MAG: hypothetical protein ACRCYX_05205, partial [Dermatophilaceae bacterium]